MSSFRSFARLATAFAAGLSLLGANAAPPDDAAGSGPARAGWIWMGGVWLGGGLVSPQVALDGAVMEVYSVSSLNWSAARFDPHSKTITATFQSPELASSPWGLQVARAGHGKQEIVVALGDGVLLHHDLATKKLLRSEDSPCAGIGLISYAVADLDGDGIDDSIASCRDQSLHVWGRHIAPWSLPGVGSIDMTVAQMDSDPALEIATAGGYVIDSATHAVQWSNPGGFQAPVRTADLQHDGRLSLVAGTRYGLAAFDVQQQKAIWQRNDVGAVSTLAVGDLKGDGRLEIVSPSPFGLSVYDAANGRSVGTFGSYGTSYGAVAIADIDGDGRQDVLASGQGGVVVFDAGSSKPRYQWASLGGAFIGPLVGDLDGDGIPEIVAVSAFSNDNGFQEGSRVVVLDSRTLKVRAISAPVAGAWDTVRDVKLRDLDGDGRMEILMALSSGYEGLAVAWRLSADNQFQAVWSNATHPSDVAFGSVDAGMVGGQPAVFAGTSQTSSGAEGTFVYAYSVATGAQLWRSPALSTAYFPKVTKLVVADFDGDGAPEVAALVQGDSVSVLSQSNGAMEASFPIRGVSLAAFAGTPTALAVGTDDGRISVHAFSAGGYPEISSTSVSDAAVLGLTQLPDGRIAYATHGEQFIAGDVAFQSDNYGIDDAAVIVGSRLICAGQGGLYGFKLR